MSNIVFFFYFIRHRFLVLTKVTTLTEQTFSDLDDGKAHRYIIFTIIRGIFNFF